MTEVEKWTSYGVRLRRAGKTHTLEYRAVVERLQIALDEVRASAPPPEPVPVRVPSVPEKKIGVRPDNDSGSVEEWQNYVDHLALAGEEYSDEYTAARYRLEKAGRLRALRGRAPYPVIEHPNGAIPHDWPLPLHDGSGKLKAHHKWLSDEREEGANHFFHQGRKAS